MPIFPSPLNGTSKSRMSSLTRFSPNAASSTTEAKTAKHFFMVASFHSFTLLLTVLKSTVSVRLPDSGTVAV